MNVNTLVGILLCSVALTASGQLIDGESDLKVVEYGTSNGSFSWKNCDSKDKNILTFTTAQLLPDPLELSGQKVAIKFLLAFNLSMELGAENKTIEIDLSLRLKTPQGYTELCGIFGKHICHFNDICSELDKLQKQCDKHGIHCSCPFKPKSYILPPVKFPIDPLPFLLKGTFNGTVFVKQLGKHVGCLDIHFCVTECMF
ncbi:Ganglioside GM2 activator [Mactra antiquata]